jgi:hypothetical protein
MKRYSSRSGKHVSTLIRRAWRGGSVRFGVAITIIGDVQSGPSMLLQRRDATRAVTLPAHGASPSPPPPGLSEKSCTGSSRRGVPTGLSHT